MHKNSRAHLKAAVELAQVEEVAEQSHTLLQSIASLLHQTADNKLGPSGSLDTSQSEGKSQETGTTRQDRCGMKDRSTFKKLAGEFVPMKMVLGGFSSYLQRTTNMLGADPGTYRLGFRNGISPNAYEPNRSTRNDLIHPWLRGASSFPAVNDLIRLEQSWALHMES